MRLPGRLAAAMAVLDEVETRHRPVSEALKTWGVENRFAGSADRAAIGNLVYDALRRRASHGFAMGEESPRALVLSVAVRDWGEDPEALAASFVGDRFAPGPITAEEAARLGAPDPLAGAPDHVQADVPEWAAAALAAAFGAEWITEGQAMAGRPPLDLRVNSLKSSRERVMKALARFHPEEAPIAPFGVRLAAGPREARTPNVTSDEGFLKGWFEVQDAGSQIASALVGARPGEQVLDFCAGGGGKTLAIAATMETRGQIFAHDRDRNRLAPIYERLQRAGVRNTQVRPPDPGVLDDLVGRMDRVVVDAPCTGSGTWRRHPDAKWRLTAEQLTRRTAEQAAILDEAARFVKPGGVLVYITCSLFPEENGRQVHAFLAREPDFAVLDPAAGWREALAEAPLAAHVMAEGLLLTPQRTGTDGFFVARLVRSD